MKIFPMWHSEAQTGQLQTNHTKRHFANGTIKTLSTLDNVRNRDMNKQTKTRFETKTHDAKKRLERQNGENKRQTKRRRFSESLISTLESHLFLLRLYSLFSRTRLKSFPYILQPFCFLSFPKLNSLVFLFKINLLLTFFQTYFFLSFTRVHSLLSIFRIKYLQSLFYICSHFKINSLQIHFSFSRCISLFQCLSISFSLPFSPLSSPHKRSSPFSLSSTSLSFPLHFLFFILLISTPTSYANENLRHEFTPQIESVGADFYSKQIDRRKNDLTKSTASTVTGADAFNRRRDNLSGAGHRRDAPWRHEVVWRDAEERREDAGKSEAASAATSVVVTVGQTVVIVCPLSDAVAWMKENAGILFMRDRYVGLFSMKSKYGVRILPSPPTKFGAAVETSKKQRSNEYLLKVFDAELRDAAIYTCQNPQGKKINVTLNVIAAPKCSPQKLDYLREGEKLLLTCSVEAAGSMLPDLYWTKDLYPEKLGQLKIPNRFSTSPVRTVYNQHQVRVSHRENETNFTCAVALSGLNRPKRPLSCLVKTLNVLFKPKIICKNEQSRQMWENDKFYISCDILANPFKQVEQYTWLVRPNDTSSFTPKNHSGLSTRERGVRSGVRTWIFFEDDFQDGTKFELQVFTHDSRLSKSIVLTSPRHWRWMAPLLALILLLFLVASTALVLFLLRKSTLARLRHRLRVAGLSETWTRASPVKGEDPAYVDPETMKREVAIFAEKTREKTREKLNQGDEKNIVRENS